MSRLLSRPTLDAAPRALVVPDPADDPFTKRRVEEAAADAYERGLADGRRAAVDEARTAASEAAGSLTRMFEQRVSEVLAELSELRSAEALADVELAARIAEVVVGREPHDDGKVLLERCRSALAALDDAPLQVAVNAHDVELLRSELSSAGGVDVIEDPSLAPGEALIRGSWGRADLTRETAWRLVRETLEDEHG